MIENKRKNIRIYAASGILAIFITFLSPSFFVSTNAQAQNKNSNPPINKNTNTQPKPGSNANINPSPGSSTAANTLFNPTKYDNLGDLIVGVTKNFVLILAVVSVAFIVLGGAQLVISAGNTEAIEKGKKIITWSILGLVFALLSFSIVAIIENLIGANY